MEKWHLSRILTDEWESTQYRSRRERLQAEEEICKIWKCESNRHIGGRTRISLPCPNERCRGERDVPEKLKCLHSLLNGWTLSCKHGRVSGDGQVHQSVVGGLRGYSASRGVGHTGSSGLTWEPDKNLDSGPKLRPQSQNSEFLAMGLGNLCCTKMSGWFWSIFKFEMHSPSNSLEAEGGCRRTDWSCIDPNSSARKKARARGMHFSGTGFARKTFLKPHVYRI